MNDIMDVMYVMYGMYVMYVMYLIDMHANWIQQPPNLPLLTYPTYQDGRMVSHNEDTAE